MDGLPIPLPLSHQIDGAIFNGASGLGMLGADPTMASGVQCSPRLQPAECVALYNGDGYARRLVDEIVGDGTNKGWAIGPVKAVSAEGQITVRADPDMVAEQARLDVREVIAESWRYGRAHGCGYALLVTKDGGRLSDPLDLRTVKTVYAIHPAPWWEMMPTQISKDLRNVYVKYGTPIMYRYAPRLGGSVDVHASRVLVFKGAPVDPHTYQLNYYKNDSIYQATYDQISAMSLGDRARGVQSQRNGIPVLKVQDLAAKMAGEERQKFLSEVIAGIQQSISLVNMMLIGSGDEIAFQSQDLSGIDKLASADRAALAAVSGVSQTQLYGETPSGLNSDGDSHRKLRQAMVGAAQEYVLRDPLTKLSRILYAQQDGPWGGTAPDRWWITWNPLEERTPDEIANERAKYQIMDAGYIRDGVYSPADVRAARFGEDGWQAEVKATEPEAEPDTTPPLVGYVTAMSELTRLANIGEITPEQARVVAEFFAGPDRAEQLASTLSPVEPPDAPAEEP